MSRTLYIGWSDGYLCHVPITSSADRSTGSSTYRLRVERLQRGAPSVAAMAELFGLSRQHVYRLLDGTYLPSVPTAQRIADALDLPVEDLFERA
jgi:DNA-binding XRE family transcriptional regulator